MAQHRNETISELRHKIRVLEEENAHLSERAEDSLLLGLIADAIEHLSSQSEILENVLERISILKNVPYCTCGELNEGQLRPIASYASFSEKENVGYPVMLEEAIIQELKDRPIILETGHSLIFNFRDEDFKPALAAIIAFNSHPIPEGLFVFVSGSETPSTFPAKIPLLDQVVEMAIRRIDNLFLIEELNRLNDVLEHRVEERTQELVAANQRLAQAQKMEAIGTLAGGIAHDFNNILSAVIGYAELSLPLTPKGSVLSTNVSHMLQAGLRARDLVQQILTFSRPDEQLFHPLQIGPIIVEALKLLRATLPSTIEMTFNPQPCLDDVVASATQIHQIIMNLCTNAAQAMAVSGGRLDIQLEQIELSAKDMVNISGWDGLKPGSYLKISIKDTGCGIPQKLLTSIFDPYFTTKEKGRGTGLGLAVVHGIVKACKGGISVHSAVGTGTTFSVYLPAVKNEINIAPAAKEYLSSGTERILIVDDEPGLAQLAAAMLGKYGYQCIECSGSLEALDVFRSQCHNIDLVLTDLTMPKMSGDRLASEIIKIRPDIPVILCTGYSSPITELDKGISGIKAVLRKPLLLNDLMKTVRKVLDQG
jgi:signal transduction histidine kinase/ActR/RegA family two-component response regulator